MVEVRDIARNEEPPAQAYHVIIEFAGGRFVANGYGSEKALDAFWRPTAFDTLDEAIASSIAWASNNLVPVVYVRGVRGRVDPVGRRSSNPPIGDQAAIGDDPESRGDPYVGSAKQA